MSPEATAAVVGAAVGGGLAFLAQLGVLAFQGRRERRAAAKIIYAELTVALAEVGAVLAVGGPWPSSAGAPRRTAWESFGVKLVGKPGVERLAHVASAYSRLDDFAWLAQSGNLSAKPGEYDAWLSDIQLGLYEVGRLTGMSNRQLRDRLVLDDGVKERLAALQKVSRRGRFQRW